MIEVEKVTLPSVWACALINGDYSGLEEKEERRCRAAEEELARQYCRVVALEIGSARFTWHYGLYDKGAGVQGGEVSDYIVHCFDARQRFIDAHGYVPEQHSEGRDSATGRRGA